MRVDGVGGRQLDHRNHTGFWTRQRASAVPDCAQPRGAPRDPGELVLNDQHAPGDPSRRAASTAAAATAARSATGTQSAHASSANAATMRLLACSRRPDGRRGRRNSVDHGSIGNGLRVDDGQQRPVDHDRRGAPAAQEMARSLSPWAPDTGAARTGTATVAGLTFTVTQSGSCASSINPSRPIDRRVRRVRNDDRGCRRRPAALWTATSGASWLTFTSGTSGNGSGTVGFTIAANTGAGRTGTLSIAGQTFTVTQASGCTFAISPGTASLGSSGGAGVPVAVTAGSGCTWTSTTADAWLTVTSGASGTGNGTVAFTAAANTGIARTGSIAIATKTFTVTQATAARM